MPVEAILAAAFFMSHGARNWPFLMLIGLPVAPAASSRSVWRHRKAGICRTSTTSATGAHCSGRERRSAPAGRSSRALRRGSAAPLQARCRARRRARSGSPCRTRSCRSARSSSLAAISASAALISSACARDSSVFGPTMKTSGRSLPSVRSPIVTWRGAQLVMRSPAVHSSPSRRRGPRAAELQQRVGSGFPLRGNDG